MSCAAISRVACFGKPDVVWVLFIYFSADFRDLKARKRTSGMNATEKSSARIARSYVGEPLYAIAVSSEEEAENAAGGNKRS